MKMRIAPAIDPTMMPIVAVLRPVELLDEDEG